MESQNFLIAIFVGQIITTDGEKMKRKNKKLFKMKFRRETNREINEYINER